MLNKIRNFFENDYLINGLMFIFGLILFVWGQIVLNKTRGEFL